MSEYIIEYKCMSVRHHYEANRLKINDNQSLK